MSITLILYEDRYHEDFRRLNLEWLDKYHLKEQHDLDILDDPNGLVIDPGGVLYLAKAGNRIVGSCGLMIESDGVYELVKMAVDPDFRGQGIARMLIEKCLDVARSRQYKMVSLFSNHQLKTALKIYEQYGFQYVSAENAPFETADIRMELVL